MIKARKLGHVVLNVSDVKASRDFYIKVLGLEVAAENETGDAVFLSLGEEHHDLALFQRATGARPGKDQPGLIHMAWQLGSFEELQAAYKELKAEGIEPETIQHNVTNSLYVADPDGNMIELYCDRWDGGIEVMRAKGPQRKPLDIETGKVPADAE